MAISANLQINEFSIFKYIVILISTIMSLYLGYVCRINVFGYSGVILYLWIFNVVLLFYLISYYLSLFSSNDISVEGFLKAIGFMFFVIFHSTIWITFFWTIFSHSSFVMDTDLVNIEKVIWTRGELSSVFDYLVRELGYVNFFDSQSKENILLSANNPEDLRELIIKHYRKNISVLNSVRADQLGFLLVILSLYILSSTVSMFFNLSFVTRKLGVIEGGLKIAFNEGKMAGTGLLLTLEELSSIFNKLQKYYPQAKGSYDYFSLLFAEFLGYGEFRNLVWFLFSRAKEFLELSKRKGRYLGGGNLDHSRLLDEFNNEEID